MKTYKSRIFRADGRAINVTVPTDDGYPQATNLERATSTLEIHTGDLKTTLANLARNAGTDDTQTVAAACGIIAKAIEDIQALTN